MIALSNSSGAHASADSSYFVYQLQVAQVAVRVLCRGVMRVSVSSIDDLVENGVCERWISQNQPWAPRTSFPGNSPVATPSSNVTDPRLIVW